MTVTLKESKIWCLQIDRRLIIGRLIEEFGISIGHFDQKLLHRIAAKFVPPLMTIAKRKSSGSLPATP